MRRFLGLLFLPVLSLAAWAGDPPKADAPPQHHTRITWVERFTQANMAHDGHLTLAEAKGGYALVAKHFDDIDADHKGYVTENDIRAWRVMRRAARQLTDPPEERLKARSAMQLGPLGHEAVTASPIQTLGVPAYPQAAQRDEAGKD